MNRHLSSCILSLILFAGCQSEPNNSQNTNLTFVDPLIGTAPATTETARLHSEAGSELLAQTFPAVTTPFGMTQWTPQTRSTEQKCIAPYYYNDDSLQGFRGSHWLSGSCTQDYGSVTIMALQGSLKVDPKQRASSFTHDQEEATPDYYSVRLEDYDMQAELTADTRSAMMQFTPDVADSTYILVEPNSDTGEGFIEVNTSLNEISGYNPVHRIYQGWGENAGFSGYFVVQFDRPIGSYGTWNDTDIQESGKALENPKKAFGAYAKFAVEEGKPLRVRVGTSFVSVNQARKNLNAEINTWNFDQVKRKLTQNWQKELQKIKVEGGDNEAKSMFYTALYHTMLLPRVFNDVDGAYVGFAGSKKVFLAEDFNYYDDFSMWDTYRAVHPLFTLIEPKRSRDMVKSMVDKAEKGGWLPIFPAWNSYTAAMIGDHATAMIGDAWVKGITDFDQEKAYEVMRKNAFEPNTDTASYRNGKGRRALTSYLKYGYIPLEDSVKESFHQKEQTSRTLEYAYDDFVLSQVAKKAGHEEDYQALSARAKNYQNVFDTVSGFARGRHADGSWIEPFDPIASRASFITEGSPFQYSWYVPHDVAGLIDLMGGQEAFIQKLDSFFVKRYYWHGNEPGHQTSYLYAYAGAPWKTQERVRQIIQEEYSDGPGGLSGNEDAGQMSAWLVFSMMGFYPVSPGIPCYVIGSPVFDQISISVTEKKDFTIIAHNNSPENVYIQSATLNGSPLERSYLLHQEILDGGELILQMGSEPNKEWASTTPNLPPSMGDLD